MTLMSIMNTKADFTINPKMVKSGHNKMNILLDQNGKKSIAIEWD